MAKKKSKRTSAKRQHRVGNRAPKGRSNPDIGKAHSEGVIRREDASAAISILAQTPSADGRVYIDTKDEGKTFHISSDNPPGELSASVRADTVMRLADRVLVDKITLKASTEALARFIGNLLDVVVDFAKFRQTL